MIATEAGFSPLGLIDTTWSLPGLGAYPPAAIIAGYVPALLFLLYNVPPAWRRLKAAV
jgi:hypothetical protein